MRITAAVVRGAKQPFTLETVEIDEPQGDEVRVHTIGVARILLRATGTCLFHLPAVLGHEGAGVVERVDPSVSKVAPRDHVVLTFAFWVTARIASKGAPPTTRELGLRNFSGIRKAAARR